MIISRQDSVAANSRSPNVLAGEQFEFLPTRAACYLRCSAAAVGINADWQIGGVTHISNGKMPGTNRFPIVPDDNVAVAFGQLGERLFLTYLNTTGVAIVVNTVIEIQPY